VREREVEETGEKEQRLPLCCVVFSSICCLADLSMYLSLSSRSSSPSLLLLLLHSALSFFQNGFLESEKCGGFLSTSLSALSIL
jgi:hypothetical protein